MTRPIAISLSPNTEKDDIFLALKTVFSPWTWYKKETVQEFEASFLRLFGDEYFASAVNSGRSAVYLLLKALGIGAGDEVIIQAFTCVAVPNSIIWSGAKVVYVDIDENYNIDTVDLVRKISPNTKAVIVQNTFGIPADYQKIKEIIKGKNICLIEDGAHSLGALYKGDKVGTLGEVSFFSFGRDKIISSVFGGIILCKNKSIYSKILPEVNKLKYPSFLWILQQLFHPIAFSIILPLYNIYIGKVILFFFQKIGMLSKAVYPEEKKGLRPEVFPRKMPAGLVKLASHQLRKLERFNTHRKMITDFYFQNLKKTGIVLPDRNAGSVWLRFPVRMKNSLGFINDAKRKGVLLGDWYKSVIMPVKNYSLVGYDSESCPMAEVMAGETVNLPTYPSFTIKNAKSVIKLLKLWQRKK